MSASQQPSRALEFTPPISSDVSSRPEVESSGALVRYLDDVFPLADKANTQHREGVLNELVALFRQWVRQLCVSKGVYRDLEAAAEAGGAMFVSGSFKLGVNSPDSDIDVIAIAPMHVTREDFFDSLVALLRAQPGIDRLLPIPETKVPIIEMVFHGVSIDLGFASVPLNSVPADINILNDSVLAGVDEKSMIALNGPRANEVIYRAVPNPETFKVLLRALRYWGKVRGLNSNKMGFFGGINYAILAAYICQLYPNLAPAGLLFRFFETFKHWKWPDPVMLCKPYTTNLGYPVWDRTDRRTMSQLMPILTPAYPCSNSAFNVSKSTLQVITLEIYRGFEVCDALRRSPDPASHDWSLLFKPSDFFYRFDSYLMIDISADTPEQLQTWTGFVESRIRKLVDRFDLDRLPLLMAYLNPRVFTRDEPVAVPQGTALALADAATAGGALPLDAGAPAPVATDPPRAEVKLEGSARAPEASAASDVAPWLSETKPQPPELSVDAAMTAVGSLKSPASSSSLEFLTARAGTALGLAAGAGMSSSLDAGKSTLTEGFSGEPAAADSMQAARPEALPSAQSGGATAVVTPVIVAPFAVPEDTSDGAAAGPVASSASTAVVPAPSPAPLTTRTVHTIYIGVMPDRERLKAEKLNLTPSMQAFKHDELEPWLRVGNKTGMAVRQRVVAWADLPEEVFGCPRPEAVALRHHSRTVILPHVLAHLKALNQRAHHVWVRQPAGVAAGVATTAAPAVASLPEVSLAAANAAVAAMTPVQRGWLASLQSGVPPSAETLTAMMSAVASAAGLSIPQAALPATGPVQTGLPGLMRTSGAPSASGAPAASQTAQLGTPAGLWAHAVASGGAHRGAADPPRAGPLVRAGGGGASAPRGLPGLTVAPSSAATSATPAAGRQPPRLPNPMHQPPRGPNAATRPLPPALRPPAAAGVNGGGGIRPGGAIAAAPLADRGRPLQTATPASAPPATAAATGLTPALASAVLGGASEAAGAPVAVAADAAVPQSMAGQKRPASTLAELPASGGAGVESVARVLIPGGGEAGDAGAASHKRRSPRSGDADADDAAAALVSAVGPAPLLSDASWPTVSTAVGVGSRISSAVPRGWQQQAQSKAGSSGSGLPGVGTGAPAPQSASSTLVPRAWSSSAATRGPGAK